MWGNLSTEGLLHHLSTHTVANHHQLGQLTRRVFRVRVGWDVCTSLLRPLAAPLLLLAAPLLLLDAPLLLD
jgi:hypothetical protein